MVEIQHAGSGGQVHGVRLVLDLHRGVQDRDDTFRAGQGLLHAFQQVGQAGDRLVEQT